ncbi:hypothetical protein TrST_g6091 [Triparma strigata]|uniref:Nudix hydrolase domain-containing protein n=1 Tax=Triparma strigata TaxID=1606541 RepID=A0A9W7EX97_9STRA|nr:hypothetical protein TrST_g6091 [Triparma strigata]
MNSATAHDSLDSYFQAVPEPSPVISHYTLILLIQPSTDKILLGKKLRGFGEGKFNGFGGKPNPNESMRDCALRETEEECGVIVPPEFLLSGGTLTFTGLAPKQMIVHLYRVNLDNFPFKVVLSDEMDPTWFPITSIPFSLMFDDDKFWLPKLLSKAWSADCALEGNFHFDGDFVSNYILTHNDNLEKKLFHELHRGGGRLSLKEYNEALHFALMTQRRFKKSKVERIIDVCGGHGALLHWLMIRFPNCKSGVVIDPAKCDSGRTKVQNIFTPLLQKKSQTVKYVNEKLEDALLKEIDASPSPSTTLVVACHACQYLTTRIIEACEARKVAYISVMPCCQKDETGGFRALGQKLFKSGKVEAGVVSDMMTAGKLSHFYHVKVTLIDEKITPLNRVITGEWADTNNADTTNPKDEQRLQRAYKKAHQNTNPKSKIRRIKQNSFYAATSFALLAILSQPSFFFSLPKQPPAPRLATSNTILTTLFGSIIGFAAGKLYYGGAPKEK